jgi:para-aminobenzoate synthetase/4-amino-4-deoxychorismate lyase
MAKVVFGSAKTRNGGWRLVLDDPLEVRVARRIEEVLPLLEFAEQQARTNTYVAVMISYEAAAAFDSALVTHEPSEFPLAWVGVFADATDREEYADGGFEAGEWTPKVEKQEYDAAVGRIRELIAAGDTYQVNYSFPLTAPFSGDAYAWHRELCVAQGAPYSVYLDLAPDLERYKILCFSPELFFKRWDDHVVTKPMKGTKTRGRWPGEDREHADWLRESPKDRAENVMIVDLLRNDLGKVSVPGTVDTTSLFDLERFETVWQMTSTVESTLRPGTTLVELMSALFPCGSVTGAPKIRTMQIIRELERYPRGVYTGAIGFLFPDGDCLFNVAIRTIVVDVQTGEATFGVGGGVTIDSTAAGEYDECIVKSRFLHTNPVEAITLFETMLFEDGEIFLRDKHLERLRNSAAYFGFRLDEKLIAQLLDSISSPPLVKLKLIVPTNDPIRIKKFPITESSEPKRVSLAPTPVNSADRFLYHKTTNREYPEDLILWNERNEVTESGTANIVVKIDGELFTPPISCGLLPGTFREHLLEQGAIKERVITVEEFKNAEEIYLINSVRKWMKAVCVGPCSSVA